MFPILSTILFLGSAACFLAAVCRFSEHKDDRLVDVAVGLGIAALLCRWSASSLLLLLKGLFWGALIILAICVLGAALVCLDERVRKRWQKK